MRKAGQPRPGRRARFIRALVIELAVLALLVGPVAYLFVEPDNPTGLRLVLAGGPSMQPLLGTMNVLLMRQTHTFRRFDVVQVHRDGIHRIVALPGEIYWVRNGHICVAAPQAAARCMDEPYVGISNPRWNTAPRRLGPDQYAWMADNRSMRFLIVRHLRQFDAILLRPIFSWGGRFH